MTTPRLEVAIATMHCQDPLALKRRLGLAGTTAECLVVNQVEGSAPPPIVMPGLRMHSYAERGAARSRNRALELSDADVLLFGDDDLQYESGFEAGVLDAFARHPDADGITFQYLNAESGVPARPYPETGRAHSPWSVLGVGTVEIALRPARFRGLRFDTRFGAGAHYPSGDEPIFLIDAMRAGRRLRFCPLSLSRHPEQSSGRRVWTEQETRSRGAALRRMFPTVWPALLAAIAVTKYRDHTDLPPDRWLRALWQGGHGLVSLEP